MEGLQGADFEEGHEEGQGRLGPFILVDPVGLKSIVTTAGTGIVYGEIEVVAAEKPFKRPLSLGVPLVVAGEVVGFDAGRDHGMGLDRLLVKPGPGLAPGIVTIGADGHKMPLVRPLDRG